MTGSTEEGPTSGQEIKIEQAKTLPLPVRKKSSLKDGVKAGLGSENICSHGGKGGTRTFAAACMNGGSADKAAVQTA